MSKKYMLKRILWWFATCVICAVAFFWVFAKEETKSLNNCVISIWHIDTFEGGKGSRAAFLGKVAAMFEKEESGNTVVMVGSRTVEGAKAALEQGDRPDLISFGSYFPYLTEMGEPTVWCRGGYAIYAKENDFSLLSSTNCVLSVGGRNRSEVAAALYGMTGEVMLEDSTTAYVKFLNGEYRYLLGTQRDACRFLSRGISVYCTPIAQFSDLQQYILSLSVENKLTCEKFIKYLLSEKCQKLLPTIGMFSPIFKVYNSGEELLCAMESVEPTYTVSPFIDDAARAAISQAAKNAMLGGNREVLKNFLKLT